MRLVLILLALCLSGCGTASAYQLRVDRDVVLHGRCEMICDRWRMDINAQIMPAFRYIPKYDICRCYAPMAPGEEGRNEWRARPVAADFPAPRLGDAL